MKSIISLFILLFIFSSAKIYSQAEQIEPDRPDQTDSPNIIPIGFLQLETGVVYEKDVTDNVQTKNFTIPNILIRYGVLKNFELRLTLNNVQYKTTVDNVSNEVNGLQPLSLGFKLKIFEGKKWIPNSAIEANFTFPKIASKNFQTDFFSPSIALNLSNNLSNTFSLGYSLGARWDGVSPETNFFYSSSFGISLSEKVSGFFELYGNLPEKTKADHRLDFGLTYIALNNLSVDIAFGAGITDNAPNYFIGSGFSYRLPK
jgi:hypothetical protein